MAEVYRLFDRRYRTATVLAKLVRLCQRAHRFTHVRQVLKGLLSANLEKALTFLDEACSATSNAVERGNHRYRKMQKAVYRVRMADHDSPWTCSTRPSHNRELRL